MPSRLNKKNINDERREIIKKIYLFFSFLFENINRMKYLKFFTYVLKKAKKKKNQQQNQKTNKTELLLIIIILKKCIIWIFFFPYFIFTHR